MEWYFYFFPAIAQPNFLFCGAFCSPSRRLFCVTGKFRRVNSSSFSLSLKCLPKLRLRDNSCRIYGDFRKVFALRPRLHILRAAANPRAQSNCQKTCQESWESEKDCLGLRRSRMRAGGRNGIQMPDQLKNSLLQCLKFKTYDYLPRASCPEHVHFVL